MPSDLNNSAIPSTSSLSSSTYRCLIGDSFAGPAPGSSVPGTAAWRRLRTTRIRRAYATHEECINATGPAAGCVLMAR